MVRGVNYTQSIKTIYNKKTIIKISVFIISVYTRKMKNIVPKVFWVFDFGHFFCPFLKRGNTFGKTELQNSLQSIMI